MPQELFIIFLLFFAVLAFGWFYWQRAKARDAGKAQVAHSPDDTPGEAHAATAADAPSEAAERSPSRPAS